MTEIPSAVLYKGRAVLPLRGLSSFLSSITRQSRNQTSTFPTFSNLYRKISYRT